MSFENRTESSLQGQWLAASRHPLGLRITAGILFLFLPLPARLHNLHSAAIDHVQLHLSDQNPIVHMSKGIKVSTCAEKRTAIKLGVHRAVQLSPNKLMHELIQNVVDTTIHCS